MEPRVLILLSEGTLLEIEPIYLVVYRLRQGERTKEYTNKNIFYQSSRAKKSQQNANREGQRFQEPVNVK